MEEQKEFGNNKDNEINDIKEKEKQQKPMEEKQNKNKNKKYEFKNEGILLIFNKIVIEYVLNIKNIKIN